MVYSRYIFTHTGHEPLGMPLYAEDWKGWMDKRFDCAVWCTGSRGQAIRDMVNGLVVVTVNLTGRIEQLPQQAGILDWMAAIGMPLHVLVQRAAEKYVNRLQTAAYAEHWFAACIECFKQLMFFPVAHRVDRKAREVGTVLPIASRMQVAAACKQKPIAPRGEGRSSAATVQNASAACRGQAGGIQGGLATLYRQISNKLAAGNKDKSLIHSFFLQKVFFR